MSATLTPEVAAKVLTADLANILQKVKSGKPLTKYERGVLEANAPKKRRPAATVDAEQAFDSMSAAAAGLGIPKHVLQSAKSSGQCQDAFRGSRVYVTESLTLFIGAHGVELTTPDKNFWTAKRARQLVEQDEFRFACERGLYKEKKVFASDLMELGASQKALLRQKLENEYPGLCPGLEPEQRAKLKEFGRVLADELCRRMQRLVDKWKD